MESPKAIFMIQCWGCNKSVSRDYSSIEDMDQKTDELRAQGWRRREFGPNASPWFCSEDCALHSYNAKRAEEWWEQRKYQEYCDRQVVHPRYYGLIGIAAFATILTVMALLSECIHAGTQ